MKKCKSPIFKWSNHANRTRKTPDTMEPIPSDFEIPLHGNTEESAEREALTLLRESGFRELTDERVSELFSKSRITVRKSEISNGTVRDMLTIVGFLHRGDVSSNITGNRRLSSKIFHAIEDERFEKCSPSSQAILRLWHERTGSFFPAPQLLCVPISEIIESEADLIENSGTDLSLLTDSDLEENLTSKKNISVICGACGEAKTLTVSSFRNSISYALRNRTLLSCADCNVTTGRLEDAISAYCIGLVDGMAISDTERPDFVTQYRATGIEKMPYDGAFVFPDGHVFAIEVDGGYHWKNRNGDALKKKIDADRVKTKRMLTDGHSMLRIDERSSTQLTQQMKDSIKLGLKRQGPRYEVIGEECPGAALVSVELKDEPQRSSNHSMS